jgi:plasmid stabilization system protein ParE
MNIIWSATARGRISEIVDYISQESPDAAIALIDKIEVSVSGLKQNPWIGRMIPEMDNHNIREIVLHQNYGVIYEVFPDRVEILTIRHFRKAFSDQERPRSR